MSNTQTQLARRPAPYIPLAYEDVSEQYVTQPPEIIYVARVPTNPAPGVTYIVMAPPRVERVVMSDDSTVISVVMIFVVAIVIVALAWIGWQVLTMLDSGSAANLVGLFVGGAIALAGAAAASWLAKDD